MMLQVDANLADHDRGDHDRPAPAIRQQQGRHGNASGRETEGQARTEVVPCQFRTDRITGRDEREQRHTTAVRRFGYVLQMSQGRLPSFRRPSRGSADAISGHHSPNRQDGSGAVDVARRPPGLADLMAVMMSGPGPSPVPPGQVRRGSRVSSGPVRGCFPNRLTSSPQSSRVRQAAQTAPPGGL